MKVDDPARLMDFEQFAEAGCRAMGFEEWEFVDAYKANRHGSMVVAAESSAVGRAVLAFMRDVGGFRGQIQHLYIRLSHYDYKGDTSSRDWPKNATRLSTELSRLSKPLPALSIRCLTKVDRRQEGGTQKDVVIEYVLKSTVKKKVEEEQPQAKTKEVGKVVKRPSWRRI